MKRFALLMLSLMALFRVPCSDVTPDESISEVPFTFEHGYVVVQAKIKRDVPVEMLLATGSEHSIIDDGLLQKYKLPSSYSAEPPITGHNDKEYLFATVPDIRVGEVKMAELNMRFGSLGAVSRMVGREVLGIFGVDFFKGRAVQLDFAKKVLRFLPQSAAKMLEENGAGENATQRIVLPMRSYKEGVTIPVVENVVFDGKKIRTLFDTGTVTIVSITPAATKELGLTAPPEKGAPRAAKVGSLRFDTYELNTVPVWLIAKGGGLDRSLSEFGAVAGTILLQKFVATFDFRKGLLILEPI